MKETNPKNVFITVLLVFSCIVTIYSFSITATGINIASGGFKATDSIFESLCGTSEFYFIPAGENRVWHVVNKYCTAGSDEEPGLITAEYTFNKDSVTVINVYPGMTATGWQVLSLPGFLVNKNYNSKN